ncbi:hypothetical protein PSTG_06690 [Puccinia striiformis f. sp. tritici PST-78]|uniref:Uncharacterized protein n=1 Tax=Puccinia striiformis f. sp. tritici PST-78 TaxID=1165861 RepID=A0A0L0VLA7_9BASI|nr:hypothetical protein PSTG_06690 [Puccinia striiformis f. sp. tritici PST-78]
MRQIMHRPADCSYLYGLIGCRRANQSNTQQFVKRAAAQKPCSPTEGTSACDSHFTSQHSQSEVNPSPYNSGVRQQRALAHLNRRFTSKVSIVIYSSCSHVSVLFTTRVTFPLHLIVPSLLIVAVPQEVYADKDLLATIDRVGQLIDPTDGSDSEIANANGEDC